MKVALVFSAILMTQLVSQIQGLNIQFDGNAMTVDCQNDNYIYIDSSQTNDCHSLDTGEKVTSLTFVNCDSLSPEQRCYYRSYQGQFQIGSAFSNCELTGSLRLPERIIHADQINFEMSRLSSLELPTNDYDHLNFRQSPLTSITYYEPSCDNSYISGGREYFEIGINHDSFLNSKVLTRAPSRAKYIFNGEHPFFKSPILSYTMTQEHRLPEVMSVYALYIPQDITFDDNMYDTFSGRNDVYNLVIDWVIVEDNPLNAGTKLWPPANPDYYNLADLQLKCAVAFYEPRNDWTGVDKLCNAQVNYGLRRDDWLCKDIVCPSGTTLKYDMTKCKEDTCTQADCCGIFIDPYVYSQIDITPLKNTVSGLMTENADGACELN